MTPEDRGAGGGPGLDVGSRRYGAIPLDASELGPVRPFGGFRCRDPCRDDQDNCDCGCEHSPFHDVGADCVRRSDLISRGAIRPGVVLSHTGGTAAHRRFSCPPQSAVTPSRTNSYPSASRGRLDQPQLYLLSASVVAPLGTASGPALRSAVLAEHRLDELGFSGHIDSLLSPTESLDGTVVAGADVKLPGETDVEGDS